MKRASMIIRKNYLAVVFDLYKYYIIDSLLIVKEFGIKELIKRRGKKFIYLVIGYYLIRDSFLYIIIPYLFARGVM